MNGPTMFRAQKVNADTHALVSYMPLPGVGVLPVNSFLIAGSQPTLIDTGLAALREDYMNQLQSLLDLRDLRWIWLTHIDADHIGNLRAVLDAAPSARIVTTFLGMGKLGLQQFPLDRVHLLNPGQRLDLGDRELVALRPPCFDAPETTALLDTRHRVLFSSDCFGALLGEPAETANDIAPAGLREGQITWATVDAPWLHWVDGDLFESAVQEVRKLHPEMVLSSHLPPATRILDLLCDHLSKARSANPFVGPDQASFVRMMSEAAMQPA